MGACAFVAPNGPAYGNRYCRLDLIKHNLPRYGMDTLAALADPTRRAIVESLAAGPLSSGDIAARFPITKPAVSQHLKALRLARLVRVRAQAQRRIYELDPEGVGELAAWVDRLRAFWNPRLDALEANLRKEAGHA